MNDKLHISVDFTGRPELRDALEAYRKSRGITQRRFVLLGMAAYMAEQGDSERLVLDLINYIQETR